MRWRLSDRGKPDRRAFSLVEVLIALAILSFTVLTLLGLMGVGLRSLTEAKNDSVAVFIADSLRARLISDPAWPWTAESIGSVEFPTEVERYFDAEGTEVSTIDEAMFVATMKFQPSPNWPSKRLDFIVIEVTPKGTSELRPATFVVQRARQQERAK